MAGAVAGEAAAQRRPGQGQVTDHVQHLVTDELIRPPQPARVQHRGPSTTTALARLPPWRQPGGTQPRDLLGQGEGAGIGDLGAEASAA